MYPTPTGRPGGDFCQIFRRRSSIFLKRMYGLRWKFLPVPSAPSVKWASLHILRSWVIPVTPLIFIINPLQSSNNGKESKRQQNTDYFGMHRAQGIRYARNFPLCDSKKQEKYSWPYGIEEI